MMPLKCGKLVEIYKPCLNLERVAESLEDIHQITIAEEDVVMDAIIYNIVNLSTLIFLSFPSIDG